MGAKQHLYMFGESQEFSLIRKLCFQEMKPLI